MHICGGPGGLENVNVENTWLPTALARELEVRWASTQKIKPELKNRFGPRRRTNKFGLQIRSEVTN